MLKRAYLPILVLVPLVAAGCTSNTSAAGPGGGGRGGRGGRGGGGGGQPVVTTKVFQRDVPVDIAAVGNVEAYTSISVRSQVTGQLEQAFFHEGDIVKKGDQLFTIDQRPLESALQQAQANLLRDQALLNQAEAQLTRDAANGGISYSRGGNPQLVGVASFPRTPASRCMPQPTRRRGWSKPTRPRSARRRISGAAVCRRQRQGDAELYDHRSPIDGRTGATTP